MCKLNWPLSGVVLAASVSVVYGERKFTFNHSPTNEEFISKDASEVGFNVYLEEFDFIPREVSHGGKNKEACKDSMLRNYRNHVYGLSEHFKCDIKIIGGKVFNQKDNKLWSPNENEVVDSQTEPSEKERKNCNLTKLAALCSTYLTYANCIYANYIDTFRAASSHLKFQEKASQVFKDYPNNEFVDRYLSVGGSTLSFLFLEYLQRICSFVHNSCQNLHPQFKDVTGYFFTQACIVFDPITPLQGEDQIFDESIDQKSKTHLSEIERDTFINYQINPNQGTIHSQINIPLDYPYNSPVDLMKYRKQITKYRCDLLEKLYVSTNHNKFIAYHQRP